MGIQSSTYSWFPSYKLTIVDFCQVRWNQMVSLAVVLKLLPLNSRIPGTPWRYIGGKGANDWHPENVHKTYFPSSDPRRDKLFRHSFWHPIWKYIWHFLTFYSGILFDILFWHSFLAFYPASTLLTSSLAFFVTLYLASILASSFAFSDILFWPSILPLYWAFILTF